jgi:hypothetical protein
MLYSGTSNNKQVYVTPGYSPSVHIHHLHNGGWTVRFSFWPLEGIFCFARKLFSSPATPLDAGDEKCLQARNKIPKHI